MFYVMMDCVQVLMKCVKIFSKINFNFFCVSEIDIKYTIQFVEEEWNYKFVYVERPEGHLLREKIKKTVIIF